MWARRSIATSELHAETSGSGQSSTSDTVKRFLFGLHFEAKKGYHNLQVCPNIMRALQTA